MAAVAHASADRADAHAVHHLARVAVVPMLVHELTLRHRERAQLVLKHRVFVLGGINC